MNASDDPIIRQLPQLNEARLKCVVAQAAGLLAHHASCVATADMLDRISDELRAQDPEASMRGILNRVAATYGLTLEELRGPRVCARIARPRQEAMWRMRQVRNRRGEPRYSYPQIAAFLGRKDHTTVIHGVRAHERRIAEAQERAA